MTRELHNMSVPSTSTITVRRALLAGRRFRVDLESGVSRGRLAAVNRRLARTGWRAARAILEAAGDAPQDVKARAPRSHDALERHLEAALASAGVPASVGVFLDEPHDPSLPVLGAAAALAVLARRSGPAVPADPPPRALARPPDVDRSLLPGGSAVSPTEADALVRRVLDVVPARTHAMAALLQLFRVEATTAVPTASVSCERRPVLRVNPRFVAERCRTDAHLFMLVMHELHHVLLGHTRLFPRSTPAHNLAFDAVINALLCARFPQEAYTSFFTGIYGGERGPLRLLAPPGRPAVRPLSLAALHRALYDGTATAEEVFHAIVREVRLTSVSDVLLGSHGNEDEWGTEGPADPAVVDAIRRIVEKWPPPETPVRGRSLSDLVRETAVSTGLAVDPAVLATVRRALCEASVADRRVRSRGLGPVPAVVPLPDPRDRRASVARIVGATPLLYASTLADRRARPQIATHVYLDVSGSVEPWLEDLYGALVALRRHLAPAVHLFSTRVETVPLDALREGVRRTTLGTDVACVLDHALARPVRRVLVVTDGYVGQPAPSAADAARRRLDLRVLLTPGGWRRDLEGVAARFDELPALRARTSRRTS